MTNFNSQPILSSMVNTDWKTRLDEAIKNDGRSAREISLSMGRAAGYVHTLQKQDKEPTLSNIVALCKELNVSVQWLLFGVEMDSNAEELLRMYSNLPEDGRKEFMTMLRSLKALNA